MLAAYRERRHTAPPSRRSWRRIPSNFTSTAQPSPMGIGPVRASIGATNRGSPSRDRTAASVREPRGVCDRHLQDLDEAPMKLTRDGRQTPACFCNRSQSGRRSANAEDSWCSSRLSLKSSPLVRAGDGGWIVRNGPVVDGGVTAGGPLSGPCGRELVAVKLGEVVGRHQ
jgi:hypothetical protein